MRIDEQELIALAEVYADLPYEVVSEVDKCGEVFCVVAYNPQLDGCMAQGATAEEARENLRDARIDYITALLRKGVHIPTPNDISQVRQVSFAPLFEFRVDFAVLPNTPDANYRVIDLEDADLSLVRSQVYTPVTAIQEKTPLLPA